MSSKIIFMTNNHASAEGTVSTFSSENSQFPFSNTTNDFRASYWKPYGNFTIDNTNNKFYFYFSVGAPNVTLTITNASYESAYNLALEITSKLSAYVFDATCTYNYTTGKFTFSGNASYKILLSNQTNSAWDTLGFVGTNDLNLNQTATEVRVHTTEWVHYDMGYNAIVTFGALIGPRTKLWNISDSAVLTLQGNNINDFASPPFSITMQRTVDGHMGFSTLNEENSSYRYWKIIIMDRDNLDFQNAAISYIYLGDYLTLENGNINKGFTFRPVDLSTRDETESGVLYSNQKAKYYVFDQLTMGFFANEDRAAIEQLSYDMGIHTPFFMSIDPELKISSTLDELTKFGVFESMPSFSHVANDLWTCSFSFREII